MSKTKPENQTAYYQQHPPRSLADFLVQSVSLDNIESAGHGFSGRYPDGLIANPNIVFAIQCQCGSRTYSIRAESDQEEIWHHQNLVIAEKYFLECRSCHARHLFFDPSLHGYNAEVSRMESFKLGEDVESSPSGRQNEQEICECSTCRQTAFEVFARFEYPSDLFDEPDFDGQEHEFFSWFTGTGKCSTCSTLNVFIDYECA